MMTSFIQDQCITVCNVLSGLQRQHHLHILFDIVDIQFNLMQQICNQHVTSGPCPVEAYTGSMPAGMTPSMRCRCTGPLAGHHFTVCLSYVR